MIHQISADDLPLILNRAADEGWNPGLEDALPFHAAEPCGFFVKPVDYTPIASIIDVNHPNPTQPSGQQGVSVSLSVET